VLEIVKNLRKDRGGMVQHLEQAEFTHMALSLFIKQAQIAAVTADCDNEVLKDSVKKAFVVLPSSFTMHPSQVSLQHSLGPLLSVHLPRLSPPPPPPRLNHFPCPPTSFPLPVFTLFFPLSPPLTHSLALATHTISHSLVGYPTHNIALVRLAPLQIDDDEGGDDAVPSYRKTQIEFKEKQSEKERQDNPSAAQRKLAREEAKRAEQEERRKKASIKLKSGDLPAHSLPPRSPPPRNDDDDNVDGAQNLSPVQYDTISRRASGRGVGMSQFGGGGPAVVRPGNVMEAGRAHMGQRLAKSVGGHDTSLDVYGGARLVVVQCLTEDW
jgi:hypothetical protein